MAILYQILNKANGKKYIGVTSDKFYRRKAVHLYRLRNNLLSGDMQKDFNTYEESCFVFSELENGELDKLFQKEELCTNSGDYEYNRIVGGRSSVSKAQASSFHTNKLKTDENYKLDFCKKISLGLMGHKVSDETKIKMSALKKGRKMSDKFKKDRSIKYSGEGNPNTVYFLNVNTGIYYATKDIENYFGMCISHIRKLFRQKNQLLNNFVKC